MSKFFVTVKTGCSFSKYVDGVVYLKSRPVGGKANLELVKLLSKHFGRRVKIVSGFTSKKKLIAFE